MAKLENEVGTLAREVVAKRVAITSALGLALNWALAAGYVSVGLDGQLTKAVGVALSVLAVLVGVLWTRDGVTPADVTLKPVSATGAALVEAVPQATASIKAAIAEVAAAAATPVPANDSAVIA